MPSLRILIPQSTINYITNPSLRYDTTGWVSNNSTISRSFDYARFSIASLKVVTNGSFANEGVYFRVNSLRGISDNITVSVYVRGRGSVRIRLIDNPNGKEWKSKPISLTTEYWQRINVSGQSTGSNDMRLYVENAKTSAQAITFYVDGAQMERGVDATTFCDGDQKGCRWEGLNHGSISSRSSNEREGGKWITLASPDFENRDLYMTVISGFGMNPIMNVTNPFSVLPGSYFQNFKINDRVIVLNFHAKHKDFRLCSKNSLKELHSLRQYLINIIKPDLTKSSEFIIEYSDGTHPIYVKVRYEAGLEGDWDIRNKWFTSFPVRLLAVSPILYEDNQEVTSIDYQDSVILNNVTARINGRWSRLNYGVNGNVNAFELGSRKEIIAVGAFTTANNSSSAIDPNLAANRIVYWDGEKWVAFGVGANGTINDVAVAPNGYIYVTGSFTSIGGVSANGIAYYDGVIWNAMSTGLNGTGHTIKVAPNGNVFVGGEFTTAGGTSVNYIARWTGTNFFRLGSSTGLNNYVFSIDISADGNTLYAGGDFTDENGNPGSSLTRVASYNILTTVWSSLGDGFNNRVNEVVLSPANVLYAGGDFTLSGSAQLFYIGQFNGAVWIPLGVGLNSTVHSIDISKNGDLVAVGEFTQAGSVPAEKIALWNNSTWVNLDLRIGVGNNAVEVYAVQFTPNGDLFLGGTNFSSSVYSSLYAGITTVTNKGTMQVSPILYIRGAGTLRWIENQSTGKRIFLNLAVLSGEEVFIDFGRAEITSNIRGNLSFTILQGSDFRSFSLLPGDNTISTFMDNDVSAIMYMYYVPRHWSADATSEVNLL